MTANPEAGIRILQGSDRFNPMDRTGMPNGDVLESWEATPRDQCGTAEE